LSLVGTHWFTSHVAASFPKNFVVGLDHQREHPLFVGAIGADRYLHGLLPVMIELTVAGLCGFVFD
jgi:hypothetical protein